MIAWIRLTNHFIGRRRLSRLRGELRGARDALLVRLRVANLLCRLLPPLSLGTVRAAIYRQFVLGIAAHVSFLSSIRVIASGPGPAVYGRLSIGESSLIGLYPTFNLDDTITIGRCVSLGPSITIYTSTHLLGPGSRRMNPSVMTRPVMIEDGAWIGGGSTILPGVVIGRGSVVAAGAVVTDNVPPNTLVMGNPAKPVQELPWPTG